MTSSLRAWQVAAAVWAGAILVTGMLPDAGRRVDAVSGGHDDLATTAGHFAAYALLGFLLGVAPRGLEGEARPCDPGAGAGGSSRGLIELVQLPLPYRDGQLVDVLVNVAGAAVGLAVFSAVAPARRPRSRRG